MRQIPDDVYELLEANPNLSGAQVHRMTGRPPRSCRRYVHQFNEERVQPQNGQTQRIWEPCIFDIECTNFKAESIEMDLLICISLLPLSAEEPITFKLNYEDGGEDWRVFTQAINELNKYQILVGHNTHSFDFNWLWTREMVLKRRYSIPEFRPHFSFDTYQMAKALAFKGSKSLGSIAAALGIHDAEKTRIFRPDWLRINSRDRNIFEEAMDEIVYHCEEDVKLNREVFNILLPQTKGLAASQLKRAKLRG